MILRGFTLNNTPIYFEPKDIPIMINSKFTILSARNNSPLLQTKSITRGIKDELFECDFVFEKSTGKMLGYVVYRDGFYIYDMKNDSLTKITSTDNLNIIENTLMKYVTDLQPMRSRIRFKSDGKVFGLNRMLHYSNGELYIAIKGPGIKVNVDGIKLCTGSMSSEDDVAFDSEYSGGIVVLKDYHPMIKMPDGSYVKLKEE